MHNSDKLNSTTSQDIQGLKAGDRKALHRLFVQYQPQLYHFLWYRTKSVEAAEDIIQETFLRLWSNREQLKAGANIKTYLFRIASNLATDAMRKQERHRELENENLQIAIAAETSQQQLEADQLASIIEGTIAKLPEAQRLTFVLSRYENLSHKEIAEVMSISVKTVEKHIAKALKKLRVRLKSLGIPL